MKIALVMPRSFFLEIPMVMQPLGLFYLAARLESLGHITEFFDLNVDKFPPDEFDQIWVSATSPQIGEAKRIGKILQTYNAKKVLGGTLVWADPKACVDLNYDMLFGGEGDAPNTMEILLDVLDKSDFKPPFLMLPTISKSLDWVLPPVRRWSHKYKANLNGVPATTMFSTRGCTFQCAFCESGRHGVIWEDRVRYEPLDVVEYQIKECKELGFGALLYYDDIMPLNKKRTLEIMKLHRKYGMIWRCFLRSDIIEKHGGYSYLKELRDGGLVEVFVGVESASNIIKANVHKGTTIGQDTNIIHWCKDLDIRCKTSFILGLPGETKETMEETRRWILDNRPDRVQVGRFIPFPGTPITRHPERYDYKIEQEFDGNSFYMGRNHLQRSFISTSALSAEEIDNFWHNLNKELEDLGVSK